MGPGFLELELGCIDDGCVVTDSGLSPDFGEVRRGEDGARAILLRNPARVPVPLTRVSLPAPFSWDLDCADGCTEETLEPGEERVVTLVFHAAELGHHAAAVELASEAGSFAIALAGMAVELRATVSAPLPSDAPGAVRH